MNYKIIDLNTYKRKEYFNHFTKDIPCTFSITCKIDVSNIKSKKYKFYPSCIFAVTSAVNMYKEFRMAFNSKKELIVYNNMVPCYTVFNSETETFFNLWTECGKDINEFINSYNKDIKEYKNSIQMNPKENMPENVFPISALPLLHFEGFNLNLLKGYDYLLPIFTLGKYENINGRLLMPMAVQVHHGVCDGYHVSRFITTLQEIIEML